MIPADKSPAFHAWFSRHVRGRAQRSFGELRVEGLQPARALLAAVPAVVVGNHTSWWDPLVALLLAGVLGADGFALMDARNLERQPFFAKLGGFGVDLQQPPTARPRYAAKLLDRPGRASGSSPGARRPIRSGHGFAKVPPRSRAPPASSCRSPC
jgi:1-acyl-sn-glycerol-3-phosphate acyltransferase